MTTIQRILYATDFSPISEPAWDSAKQLGRLFGAEVVLLHVVPPLPVLPTKGNLPELYDELIQSARREAEAGFDRLLASVAGSGINVRIHLEDGPPAQRILEVAAKEAADLLIVGTHGRTGLSRAIFGSVADRLVRQAPCPVLTVQPTLREVPRREIRRLCYATDFSPTARAAWPWVVAIARPSGAQVDLVHVTFQPVPDRHLSAEALARMTHMLHEQGRTEAERFLAGSGLPREQIRLCLTHGDPGEQNRPPGSGAGRRPHHHGYSRLVGRRPLDARVGRAPRDPGSAVSRAHDRAHQPRLSPSSCRRAVPWRQPVMAIRPAGASLSDRLCESAPAHRDGDPPTPLCQTANSAAVAGPC